MVTTREEMILKKLFVALDDRSLNLKRIGQHLERLPRSYALESLEEAMEYRALWAEQQQQRQEEREQQAYEYIQAMNHEVNAGDMASYAYDKTWRAVLSNALWELLTKLALLIPYGLFFWLIGAIWWW